MNKGERQAYLEACLQAEFDAHDIKHFKPHEFVYSARLGVVVEYPDFPILYRIMPAVVFAEKVRREFDIPILIGNGYRPKELNKRVGGARNSQHTHFRAADLDLSHSAPWQLCKDFYRFGVEYHQTQEAKESKMGIGLYGRGGGNRLHIDFGYRYRFWGGFRGSYYKEIRKAMR